MSTEVVSDKLEQFLLGSTKRAIQKIQEEIIARHAQAAADELHQRISQLVMQTALEISSMVSVERMGVDVVIRIRDERKPRPEGEHEEGK